MATRKTSNRKKATTSRSSTRTAARKKPRAARVEKPQRGFEKQPKPEDTNYDHPDSLGARKSIPGVGITSAIDRSEPKARPDERKPLFAPGARRPDSTHSGVKSTPIQEGGGPEPSGRRATESSSGGRAPLSIPKPNQLGPQPPAPDLPGLQNPNFTRAYQQQSRAKRGKNP